MDDMQNTQNNGVQDEPAVKTTTEKKTVGRRLLELSYEVVSVFLTAVVIIMLLFTFFIRIVGVVGESMEPILHTSDWVLVSQEGDYTPKYGDIVVISQQNEYHENLIKRVIATEGHTIDIDFASGTVYLDDAEIIESYLGSPTTNYYDMEFPITVPEGYVFVMGDNRQFSIDSRSSSIGLIRVDYILGRAENALTDNGLTDITL